MVPARGASSFSIYRSGSQNAGSSAGRDIGRSPVPAMTCPGHPFTKGPSGSLCCPLPSWEETCLWSRAAGAQIASPLLRASIILARQLAVSIKRMFWTFCCPH